jgi:hypothetical protein
MNTNYNQALIDERRILQDARDELVNEGTGNPRANAGPTTGPGRNPPDIQTSPFWGADDNAGVRGLSDIDRNMISFGVERGGFRLLAPDGMTFHSTGKSSLFNNALLPFSPNTNLNNSKKPHISISSAKLLFYTQESSFTEDFRNLDLRYTERMEAEISDKNLLFIEIKGEEKIVTEMKLDRFGYGIIKAELVRPVVTIKIDEETITVSYDDVGNPWKYTSNINKNMVENKRDVYPCFTDKNSFEHFVRESEGPLVFYILKMLKNREFIEISPQGEQINVSQRDHFDAYKSFIKSGKVDILKDKGFDILDEITENEYLEKFQIFKDLKKVITVASDPYDGYVFFLVVMLAWIEELREERNKLIKVIERANINVAYQQEATKIADRLKTLEELMEKIDGWINENWFFNRLIRSSEIISDCLLLRWIFPKKLETSLSEFVARIEVATKSRQPSRVISQEFPERRERSRILIERKQKNLFDDWIVLSLLHSMIKKLYEANYVLKISVEEVEAMVRAGFYISSSSAPVTIIVDVPAKQNLSPKIIKWFGLGSMSNEDKVINNDVFEINMCFENCGAGSISAPKLSFKVTIGENTVYANCVIPNTIDHNAAHQAIVKFIKEYTGESVEEFSRSKYEKFFNHALSVSRNLIYNKTPEMWNDFKTNFAAFFEIIYGKHDISPNEEIYKSTIVSLKESRNSPVKYASEIIKALEKKVGILDVVMSENNEFLLEVARSTVSTLWGLANLDLRKEIDIFSAEFLGSMSWMFVDGMTFEDFDGAKPNGKFEGLPIKESIDKRIELLEEEINKAKKELHLIPSNSDVSSLDDSPTTSTFASPLFPKTENTNYVALRNMEDNYARLKRMKDTDKKIWFSIQKSRSATRNIPLARLGLDIIDTKDFRAPDIDDPSFYKPSKSFQSLYPYQVQLIETVGRAIVNDSELSVVFKAGVGAGKTTVCVALAKYTELLGSRTSKDKKPLFIYAATSPSLLKDMYARCMDSNIGVFSVSNVSPNFRGDLSKTIKNVTGRVIFRRPGIPPKGKNETSMISETGVGELASCTMVVCQIRTLTWVISQLEGNEGGQDDARLPVTNRPYFVVIDEIDPGNPNKESEHALGAVLALKTRQNKKIAIFSASADEKGPMRYFISHQSNVQIIKNTNILVPTVFRQINGTPQDPYSGYQNKKQNLKISEEGFYRRFISSINIDEIKNFCTFTPKEEYQKHTPPKKEKLTKGQAENEKTTTQRPPVGEKIIMYDLRVKARNFMERMKESDILDQSQIYTLFPFHQEMREFEKLQKLTYIKEFSTFGDDEKPYVEDYFLALAEEYFKSGDTEWTKNEQENPYEQRLANTIRNLPNTNPSKLSKAKENRDKVPYIYERMDSQDYVDMDSSDVDTYPYYRELYDFLGVREARSPLVEYETAKKDDILFFEQWLENTKISFDEMLKTARKLMDKLEQPVYQAIGRASDYLVDYQVQEVINKSAKESVDIIAERINGVLFLGEDTKKSTDREKGKTYLTSIINLLKRFMVTEDAAIKQELKKAYEKGKRATGNALDLKFRQDPLLADYQNKVKKPTRQSMETATSIISSFVKTLGKNTKTFKFAELIEYTRNNQGNEKAVTDYLSYKYDEIEKEVVGAIKDKIEELVYKNSKHIYSNILEDTKIYLFAKHVVTEYNASIESFEVAKNITDSLESFKKEEKLTGVEGAYNDIIHIIKCFNMVHNIEAFGNEAISKFNKTFKLLISVKNERDKEELVKTLSKSTEDPEAVKNNHSIITSFSDEFLNFCRENQSINTRAFMESCEWVWTSNEEYNIKFFNEHSTDEDARRKNIDDYKVLRMEKVIEKLKTNPYWRDIEKMAVPTEGTYRRLEQQLDELKLIKETEYYALVGTTKPKELRDGIYSGPAGIIREKILELAEFYNDYDTAEREDGLMVNNRIANAVKFKKIYDEWQETGRLKDAQVLLYKRRRVQQNDRNDPDVAVIEKAGEEPYTIIKGTYKVNNFEEWLIYLRDKNQDLVRGLNIGHTSSDRLKDIYKFALKTQTAVPQKTGEIVAEPTEGSFRENTKRNNDKHTKGIIDYWYIYIKQSTMAYGNVSDEVKERTRRLEDEIRKILEGFRIYHSVPVSVNPKNIIFIKNYPSIENVYEFLGVYSASSTADHPSYQGKLNRLFGNVFCARGLDRPIEAVIITKSYEDACTSDDILQMSGRCGRPSKSNTSVFYISYEGYMKTFKEEETDGIVNSMFRMKFYLQPSSSTKITDSISTDGRERFREFFKQVGRTNRF